jgi:hypothetical protein
MTHARTPIAIIRDHVEAWRRDNRWSRETVADQMVQVHERLGHDRLSGIHFDPPTRDAFERQRVNADRIFRWLDDATKDRNLLPINFLWSILAALPEDLRLALANALLEPVELIAAQTMGMDPAEAGADQSAVVVMHFREVVTTAAAAEVAMSQLLDGVDRGEPEAAKVKLSRLAAAGQRALALMSRLLRRTAKGAKP